jgi:hypothetical protein
MTRIIPDGGPAETCYVSQGRSAVERQSDRAAWSSVRDEHRHLGGLMRRTREALSAAGGEPLEVSSVEPARAAVRDLTAALEAHFEQEEYLYYPTIWALRPRFKKSLLDLIDCHPALRSLLADLGQALDQGAVGDALRRLEGLARFFGQHEQAEEQILQTLDREIDFSD